MKDELLKINNGTLTQHGHRLIENINLQVFKAEVHSVVFNNTEVKNALIKILCGEGTLSYGKIYFEEALIRDNEIYTLLKKNVVLIDQTSHLIPTFKLYENIFFPKFHFFHLNPRHYQKLARDLFQRFNISIPINKPVKMLTIYESVIIELLKAFALNYKLVILSNILNILNRYELNSIFELISRLKEKGMSFLVIADYEDIRLKFSDRLTAIKGGRTVITYDSKALSKEKLYRIFDIKLDSTEFSQIYNKESDTVVLSFQNVSAAILKSISFDIHKGEILRVLYTDESYANYLISILRGESVKDSGNIFFCNKLYIPSLNHLNKKNEICFIEENSVGNMLFKNLNVIENLSYPICNKFSGFWLKRRYRKSIKLKIGPIINPNMFKRSISELPQDDLQKIVYCKFLLYNPKLVVCIKPFSVVDAKNRITEKMISMLAENGISILIITSGWPSLSSIHGKILYLSDGTLSEK